jgi:hypothetical protein
MSSLGAFLPADRPRVRRWTAADRAQLVAFELVTGHVGARYLMSEATRIVESGAPRHPGRLAHAAGCWASALESLSHASAPHRVSAALRAELGHLAAVARRLQSAAEDLRGDEAAADRRARLLVAVDGYAAGVRAFWHRHEAALARLRDAA